MPHPSQEPPRADRLLVKLRPSTALRAAESRARLRPLFDALPGTADLGLAGEARWYVAEPPDGAATAWDLAHGRVADQLGVAESDVLYAEPDLAHGVFGEDEDPAARGKLGIGGWCDDEPQNGDGGKPIGPGPAWHLDDEYSQLRAAREAVHFSEPRTRIAHLDTGYYPAHSTAPRHIARELERSFVRGDGDPISAADPDGRGVPIDNTGHGTGTLGILAGRASQHLPIVLGGAPEAEILPLRIADSVILLWTSAFAAALGYAVDQRCDVVTMSMGGLPSRAWREVVDRAYLAGVCVVAAAGNNKAGIATRNVVYPARYGRVVAACGVMADHRPYADLEGLTMVGNRGPRHVMRTAISAYTPNVPWALYGCRANVRHNGEGTSSATPQVAAAAALWLERYKNELPRDWRRVEAVRNALFSTAREQDDLDRLGRGILQAAAALEVRPRFDLPRTAADDDSFAFLRVLTGLGFREIPPRERMFNLELMQRWLLNPALQEIVPDPDEAAGLDDATLKRFMGAVIEDEGASLALRKHVATRYPAIAGSSPAPTRGVVSEVLPACDDPPALAQPPYRRLRVYALDPSLSARLDTAAANVATLRVRWEPLGRRAPFGEYLAMDDVDETRRYEPVRLNDPRLLAQDGWDPAEGNPHFHQQMVYAVAMKTIDHFERALGRPVLWRHRPNPEDEYDDRVFVRRLTVRPHALRQANAFYSPRAISLEFGYFDAEPGARDLVPGSRVYTCLSHDVVAHETTHAVLDGMHRRFNEPTNPDVLALHEGFADVVALMQHFTIPELLESQIARTRGDLEAESILGSLAVQLGHATGGRGALRDAIGRLEGDRWMRFAPDTAELERRLTPHARGAVLVAAVFDAFLAIYRERTADLLRIYTGGTGVLPSGAIHPDLVRRLAGEAAKSASHVLTMCIRALDYLPPVDVTFFEYLRALITADFDIVRDDRHDYRLAFVEAFRRRGIYPADLASSDDAPRTLSVDTLRWQGLAEGRLSTEDWDRVETQYAAVLDRLRRYADACFYLRDRRALFRETRECRKSLHAQLLEAFAAVPRFAEELGLDPAARFEVHALRHAMRIGPDGRYVPQVVVALTQSVRLAVGEGPEGAGFVFRGGSTLVVDLSRQTVRYRIVKRIGSETRRRRATAFYRDSVADPLRALFFSPDRPEPFAVLHALADEGV